MQIIILLHVHCVNITQMGMNVSRRGWHVHIHVPVLHIILFTSHTWVAWMVSQNHVASLCTAVP